MKKEKKNSSHNYEEEKVYRRLQAFEIEKYGWMSVPDFTHWMIEKYKFTSAKQPITANWVHFRINERKLPQALGGNIIDIGLFGNVKYVKLLDKTYKPKPKGRIKGSKNRKKKGIGGKKVLLQHIRKDFDGTD